MESMTRNVRDLDAEKRRSLETVLGHQLQDNQQVMIQVVSLNIEPNKAQAEPPAAKDHGDATPQLPDWCNVYDGLTDDEIADLERTILRRAELTRSFD
jgi:hypothetical protein